MLEGTGGIVGGLNSLIFVWVGWWLVVRWGWGAGLSMLIGESVCS